MVAADRWAIVALTALLLVAYGTGFVGYDAAYSLGWSRDLAHARVPGIEDPVGPTAHPLLLAVGVVLVPLGNHLTGDALLVLAVASLAALGVAAHRLGALLYSRPVGVVFALVLLTRSTFVSSTYQAGVDVPFLALVLWAGVLEARRASRAAVLAALAVAGLLRPEAWLLSLAYLALRTGRARPDPHLLAIAVAAPALWAVSDLLLTGDPLFSLLETRELAERLDRPRSLSEAITLAPRYLRKVLHGPVMWVGLAGATGGLALLGRRSLVPATLVGVALVGFLVLGISGLPLRPRYLFLAAALLALFCAVAVAGWTVAEITPGVRRPWRALGLVAAAVLLASVPSDVRRLSDQRAAKDERARLQSDLEVLASSKASASTIHSCPELYTSGYRTVPLLALWLDRDPATIHLRPVAQIVRGVVVIPATMAGRQSSMFHVSERRRRFDIPPGFQIIARNRSWVAGARC